MTALPTRLTTSMALMLQAPGGSMPDAAQGRWPMLITPMLFATDRLRLGQVTAFSCQTLWSSLPSQCLGWGNCWQQALLNLDVSRWLSRFANTSIALPWQAWQRGHWWRALQHSPQPISWQPAENRRYGHQVSPPSQRQGSAMASPAAMPWGNPLTPWPRGMETQGSHRHLPSLVQGQTPTAAVVLYPVCDFGKAVAQTVNIAYPATATAEISLNFSVPTSFLGKTALPLYGHRPSSLPPKMVNIDQSLGSQTLRSPSIPTLLTAKDVQVSPHSPGQSSASSLTRTLQPQSPLRQRTENSAGVTQILQCRTAMAAAKAHSPAAELSSSHPPITIQGGIHVQITAQTIDQAHAQETARMIADQVLREVNRISDRNRFRQGL